MPLSCPVAPPSKQVASCAKKAAAARSLEDAAAKKAAEAAEKVAQEGSALANFSCTQRAVWGKKNGDN